ncbi:MAG TPA: efflux RND transporter periplasmic adaptor subunit [Verrucomicrobiae bacterium]|jgi:RND family efflux transporter MFP subunit|nr:efflux RND transporter periplasmic adaptor subunit [Verrucomicrobiae bacterium]
MKTKHIGGLAAGALVIVAAVAVYFFRPDRARAVPAPDSAPASVPVARVTRENLAEVVTIPAEFRAYAETELRAKEGGYIGHMNVDFGDRVKAGQLLATIEVPELGDELNNALAVQRRAEADFTNAHLMYTRILKVNQEHPNLVAQQDVDTATSKDLTAQAAIAAATADVGRYMTLAGYTNIVAPFDGVVTHRYLDPGALVEERSDVLRVSDNYHLRLDFPVSLKYVKDIHIGDEVKVVVESLGGRKFSGKITRASWRVDDDTRTMLTEIEVANPGLELVPGMYSSVAMEVNQRPHALAIPVEAVVAGQSNAVYVVNAQNEIEERAVTLGLETPTQYEVVSGLKEGDLVVLGRRSRLSPGQKVQPQTMASLAQR